MNPHSRNSRTHTYQATCSWTGSTGVGYAHYGREHRVSTPPLDATWSVTADPAFHGDPNLPNPEQSLLVAAMSCQLLSFLSVAARAHIDVVAYEDEARAVMPEDDPPVRITEITMRPRITVKGPVKEDQIVHFCHVAHRECFIANTLNCKMTIEPAVTIVD